MLLNRRKTRSCEVLLNGSAKSGRFSLLFSPLSSKTGHLVLEGLAVTFPRLCPHVTARGEDMARLANFLQRSALAEAGNIGIVAGVLSTLPDVLEIWPESGGSRVSGYTWGQQA